MTDTPQSSIETPPAKARRREWIGLAVLALPCMLYSMDLTVLNLALPHLSAALKPSGTQMLWIVDIYGFFVAASLITMGTLGDRIGRRKVLLAGAAAFGIASVLAAFAPTAEALIAARALLGVAAATLAPSTLSLLRNMFHDPAQRTFAIGVWVSSFSAGAAIGPLVGGMLLTWFWWGSVFLLAVPIMVVLLLIGPRLLPEFKDPQAGRLDIGSALLSLFAVLGVIYGIKKIAEQGLAETSLLSLPTLSIVTGIFLALVFVRRQLRLADPMLDLTLFRVPAFSVSLVINICGAFMAFAVFLFTAQYLQLVLGYSPLLAGLWTVPSALMFIVGSMAVSALVPHFSRGTLVASGLALTALGFFIMLGITTHSGLWLVIIGSAIYAIGLAAVFTLSTDLVVTAAPPSRAGAASAMAETSSEFGAAMGIAVLGSFTAAIYRLGILREHAQAPEIPAELASDTLAAAIALAETLPAPLGESLTNGAREAFLTGMIQVLWVSILVALVAALLALVFLKPAESADERAN